MMIMMIMMIMMSIAMQEKEEDSRLKEGSFRWQGSIRCSRLKGSSLLLALLAL